MTEARRGACNRAIADIRLLALLFLFATLIELVRTTGIQNVYKVDPPKLIHHEKPANQKNFMKYL